jgi:hypothetical protein
MTPGRTGECHLPSVFVLDEVMLTICQCWSWTKMHPISAPCTWLFLNAYKNYYPKMLTSLAYTSISFRNVTFPHSDSGSYLCQKSEVSLFSRGESFLIRHQFDFLSGIPWNPFSTGLPWGKKLYRTWIQFFPDNGPLQGIHLPRKGSWLEKNGHTKFSIIVGFVSVCAVLFLVLVLGPSSTWPLQSFNNYSYIRF